MPVPIGVYRSLGAQRRSLRFEERRGWGLSQFFQPYVDFLQRMQPQQVAPSPARTNLLSRQRQAFQMPSLAPETFEVPAMGERQGPARLQAALMQEGLSPQSYLQVIQQADEGYDDYAANRRAPAAWKWRDVRKAQNVTQRVYGQDVWQFVAGVRQERELNEFVQEQQKQVKAGAITEEQAAESIKSYAKEMGGNIRAKGILPLGELSPDTPGYGRGVKDIFAPHVRTPAEEDLGFLGPAAGPVADELRAATTPAFGIAALAVGPVEAAVGSAGAITAGTAAEAAGAPLPVRYGAEAAGGLLTASQAAAIGRGVRGGVRGAGERLLPRPPTAQVAETAWGAPLEQAAVREGVQVPEAVRAPVAEAPAAAPELPTPRVPEPSPQLQPQRFPAERQPTVPTQRGYGAFEGVPSQSEVQRITQEMDEAYQRPWTGETEPPDVLSRRDYVGEELLRRSHPTQRDVEAWSKRIPPEERAAMAEEVADTRFGIEDTETVAERWGTRFRENWFTKIDDLLAPIRGVNRTLQKQVRNSWIMRNIYARTQGARMSHAARVWTGENRRVLGLQTWGRRRGYAEGILPKPGAKIPRKLVSRLDDIIEHPDDYIISPGQARALRKQQDIFNNLSQAEQAHGVDVLPIEGGYSPRVVTVTPRGDPLQVGATRTGMRYPTTHPFYTQERVVDDVRKLYAAGYETLDPLTAMDIRMRLGAETIANSQFIRQIQGLGYKPSEKIPQTAADELRAAQKAYQAARRQAVKSGSAEARGTAEQAAARLDAAKVRMRHEAKVVAQRRPREFGRVVSEDVKAELDRYLKNMDEGGVEDFFRVLRTGTVNLDYGSLTLQNWVTFWRNNPAWLKAAVYGMRSIADNPWDYVVRNADEIDMALKYGHAVEPSEFLFARGGSASQLLGRAPGIKQSQRIFEWNVFIAQIERSKAIQRLAKTPDEFLDLGMVLRKQSGSNFMPGLTAKQAKAMAYAWFAPQFTAAIQGAVMDPLFARGVARREAIKAMGSMFGGAALMTAALHYKLNGSLPNMDDPDKPGFWGVRVGGSFVYPFGPFQPLVVALSRTARAAARTGSALAQGENPPWDAMMKRDVQAWASFAANKASIPARFAMRIAETMGIPLEDIRGPSFGRPEFRYEEEAPSEALQRGLTEFMPIGPKQAFEGWKKGEWLPTLELFGARTTVMSPMQQVREIFRRNAEAGKYGPEIQAAPDYGERPSDRALAESDPELAELLKEADKTALEKGAPYALEQQATEDFLVEQEEGLGLEDTATAFLSGETDGVAFHEKLRDFNTIVAIAWAKNYFGKDFEESDDPVAVNYREWRDLNPNDEIFRDEETGGPDWDRFYTAYYDAFEKLPKQVQKAIEQRSQVTGENAQEAEKRAKIAEKLMRELHEISPVSNLGREAYDELQDFYTEVYKFKRWALREKQTDLEFPDAVQRLARAQKRSEAFTWYALNYRPGTKARDSVRNKEYYRFLVEHVDELEPFYPDFYKSEFILGILGRMGR